MMDCLPEKDYVTQGLVMSHFYQVDNGLFSFIGYLIYGSIYIQTNNKC